MHIIAKREPFPHLIIENIFTEEEYSMVWNELMFITPKMLSPEKTGAGQTLTGDSAKRGKGIFLQHFFADRKMSDIYRISRKMFCDEIRNVSNALGLYFQQYNKLVYDSVLLQLYYNGDYYKQHNDDSVFTAVILLHKTPKLYTGGDLIFPQQNYNSNLMNNQAIIFPSIINHEVTEVKLQTNNYDDGRFTISQLCQISPYQPD